VRFGALTLPDAPWDELLARWQTLDRLGFDSIWVPDHLVGRQGARPWFECWACLAGLAHVTERARVGTLVSPIAFRNPAVLAKAAITVDHLSGGRMELGVGVGDAEADVRLAGVERPSADAARDGFERVRRLLDDPSLAPRPVQERIPLTIGGRSRRVLRAAAKLADRWNTFVGYGDSEDHALRQAQADNTALDAACKQAGRDPAEVLRSAHLGYRFVGVEPWGSADAFRAFAARWRDAGFQELILFYPPFVESLAPAVDRATAERIVAEALPELRSAP
jgi:alkanesulfonate monooxygenase SsuD/methylene tetrahydromethanopterin reductase-like flavin-dependent oxidoreductase (luciferase family)